MTPPRAELPVVVVGGGPAGAVAARGLARRGVPVLLLERTDGGGNPVGESLAPTANPLLHRLGLWDALLASGPLPCPGNRSAWGGDGTPAEHPFLREPFGHGWHLDRPAFNRALLAAAEAAGAEVRLRTEVLGVVRSGDGWRVRSAPAPARVPHPPAPSPAAAGEGETNRAPLSHRNGRGAGGEGEPGRETGDQATERGAGGDGEPEVISARFVIDATGRRALVARGQGGVPAAFDRLAAAVAFVEAGTAPFADATTLVEADPGGWWYSALLPSGGLAVARFTDPDLLAAERSWETTRWPALLDDAPLTRDRLRAHGGAPPARARVAAAGSTCLQHPVGDGWLAVGDAAAAHDPLSSHGIASAVAAGDRAAEAVALALSGDPDALPAYARRVADGFLRYLPMQGAVYAEVTRWPEAPFWSRRR